MLATLALLLFAGQAAVHPCELRPPTVYRFPASQLGNLRVGFCFDNLDTDGLPITEQVSFKLDIEGIGSFDLGPLQPVLGADAEGDSYYEFQTANLAAGSMHIHAYTASGESAASEGWTLTLLGNPKPPKNGTLIKR